MWLHHTWFLYDKETPYKVRLEACCFRLKRSTETHKEKTHPGEEEEEEEAEGEINYWGKLQEEEEIFSWMAAVNGTSSRNMERSDLRGKSKRKRRRRCKGKGERSLCDCLCDTDMLLIFISAQQVDSHFNTSCYFLASLKSSCFSFFVQCKTPVMCLCGQYWDNYIIFHLKATDTKCIQEDKPISC